MECSVRSLPRCQSCHPGPLQEWAASGNIPASTLNRIKIERRYEAGETIFHMGEPHSGLHCVSKGVVGLRLLHPDGVSVLVGVAYPGDLIGVRAFLRDGAHRTSAEALTNVSLCTLGRDGVRRLTQEHPKLHQRLVNFCLDALDASQEAMLHAAAMSNRQRLHHLLQRLLRHCGAADSSGRVRAQLPLSREDIAGMLGVRQETLSRLLRRLKEDRLIAVSGRTVELLGHERRAPGYAQDGIRGGAAFIQI